MHTDDRVSPEIIRRVWAALTNDPAASVRTMVRTLGHSGRTIHTAIHALADAGYIELGGVKAQRARRVVIPFVAQIETMPRHGQMGRRPQQ